MTDVFDRAQAREIEMREDALAEQARRHPMPAGEGPSHCQECGIEIPAGRRKAIPGVRFCVECQTDIERSGRWDWGMAE